MRPHVNLWVCVRSTRCGHTYVCGAAPVSLDVAARGIDCRTSVARVAATGGTNCRISIALDAAAQGSARWHPFLSMWPHTDLWVCVHSTRRGRTLICGSAFVSLDAAARGIDCRTSVARDAAAGGTNRHISVALDAAAKGSVWQHPFLSMRPHADLSVCVRSTRHGCTLICGSAFVSLDAAARGIDCHTSVARDAAAGGTNRRISVALDAAAKGSVRRHPFLSVRPHADLSVCVRSTRCSRTLICGSAFVSLDGAARGIDCRTSIARDAAAEGTNRRISVALDAAAQGSAR
ncbi:hypothetical protein OF83DRAFT_1180842 [Amylostereum chailletii]|nr:hypothetical protein OF83DRAFT_1180842 [Amylostereum chailletii]